MNLHEKQDEVYKHENKKAIGFIKFNQKCDDLVKGHFFLKSIENFRDNGRDKIKDDSEGIIKLTNNEMIKYGEILNGKSQTYISSFTVLFSDDFDDKGKIKETTVDKLLNKKGKKEDLEKRNAVIFNISLNDSFEAMGRNTPEFVNYKIKKPKMGMDRIQRFKTRDCLKTKNSGII